MLFRFRTIALSLFSLLLCFGLTACQKNVAPHPLEGRNLSVGVAPFVQPLTRVDLLAGFILNRGKSGSRATCRPGFPFEAKLGERPTKYRFLSRNGLPVTPVQDAQGRRSALATWLDYARKQGVEPSCSAHAPGLAERQGGDMGITVPASVNMDIFLLDTRDAAARALPGGGEIPVVQRSHYAETQEALTSNLLGIGDFFKRKGKWVTAEELCGEGMDKAILELGL